MRTFIKLSKKLLVGVVSALAICMIIGSYQTVAAEKEDKYQAKNPNSLFGIAADFGIFVNRAVIKGDLDSNYAIKNLENPEKSHSAHSPANDVFYVANHTGSLEGLQLYYEDRYVRHKKLGLANYVISGNLSVKKEANRWIVSNSEGSKKELDDKDTKVTKVNNTYIDFENEFKYLRKVSSELSAMKDTSGIERVLKKNDDRTLGDNYRNFRKIVCVANTENVINVNRDDLECDTKIDIVNIGKQKTSLVINVKTDNNNDIKLYKIWLDGNEPTSLDEGASKIIWNFGDFSGNILIEEKIAGTILAPKAKVNLKAGNLIGSVIADEFENGAEVHFVAPGFEKEEEKTPVEVCIETVDGTCCPSLPVQGGTYALYKKQRNGKYKKVAGSEKTTEFVQDVTAVDWKKPDEASEAYNTFLASWKVEETGEYYIKQIDKVSGAYTKTPTRCKFKVVDNDGKLELQLIKGKEANGESNKLMTFSFGDKKLAGFKLRNYQNIVSIASLNERQNTVLPVGNYSIYKCTADDVVNGTFGTKVAEAETDINGFRQVNIQELGYYCVVQEGTVDGYIIDTAPKYFVVFKSPIGHIIPVEFEDVQFGFRMVEALGGKFEIKKLTKTISENMNTVMAEYGIMADYYTDGWIVFINQPEAAKKTAKINEAEAAQLLGELQQEAIEQANETVQEALDQEAQNTADVQGGQE